MATGVPGDVTGDVQDPVAQAFGFADLMLGAEGELLGKDDDVVREQRELEPRRVIGEAVEREVAGAGAFQGLDAVLDHGVVSVVRFQLRGVGVGLVGDQALEAMPVQVAEGQLRAGVRALTRQIKLVPSGHSGRFTLSVSSVTPAPSRSWPS